MTAQLNKQHQLTYDAIFRHPIAHDLHRRDVTAMLTELAEVTEEGNGNLKVIRNGETLVLHASKDKNITAMGELMLIRRFLERSHGAATAEDPRTGLQMLVVLDHREARIYKTEMHGSLPMRITPYLIRMDTAGKPSLCAG